MPLAKVGSIRLCQRYWNLEKTYTAKILKLLVKVNRTTTQTILDIRTEVNIIICLTAKKLELSVRIDFFLALKAISRDI